MAQKNFADAMNQIVNGTNGLKSQINTKADKHSPNFTGTPTAVTADNETDSTQLATTEFCQNLIRRLVGSAPETLNTLVELATAINNDPTFAQTIIQVLDGKLNKTDAANTYLGKNATAASASKVIGGTITLSGSVTGSGSFNSAGNVNITTSGGGSSTGSSTTAGMTQAAITNALNNKADSSTVSSLQTTVNNKLDKSTWDGHFSVDNNGLHIKDGVISADGGIILLDTKSGGNRIVSALDSQGGNVWIKSLGVNYYFNADGIYLGNKKITN